MKNSKFKKLIVLAMLGVLTGSMSANAMEIKNEIITTETNQNYKEKIEQARKIYEEQDKIYEEMYEINKYFEDNYSKCDTQSLIENFDDNCEKYEKLVKFAGFANEPEKDKDKITNIEAEKTYYKASIFTELDKANKLIENIETDEAKELMRKIFFKKQWVDSLFGRLAWDSFADHFWCTLRTIYLELKLIMKKIDDKLAKDGTDKEYNECKEKFLKYFKEIQELCSGSAKYLYASYRFKPNPKTIKDIDFKDVTDDRDSLRKCLLKIKARYEKLKKIIDLTHERGQRYDEYDTNWLHPKQIARVYADSNSFGKKQKKEYFHHDINFFSCPYTIFNSDSDTVDNLIKALESILDKE